MAFQKLAGLPGEAQGCMIHGAGGVTRQLGEEAFPVARSRIGREAYQRLRCMWLTAQDLEPVHRAEWSSRFSPISGASAPSQRTRMRERGVSGSLRYHARTLIKSEIARSQEQNRQHEQVTTFSYSHHLHCGLPYSGSCH